MKAFLLALLFPLAMARAQTPAPAPAPTPASAPAPAQTRDLRQLLQDGLFEEEANRNFEKAAAAYESLLSGFEQQRQYAATALFRLAEVRAKQNRKDDAIALYKRVITEFRDDQLTKLSRERLAAMGGAAPADGAPTVADEEAAEIARLRALVKDSPDLLNAPDADRVTPLGKAAKEGWLKAAAFLLDNGAKTGTVIGIPPLHIAAMRGRKAMVELLLDRGADVNGKDPAGDDTPLVGAITNSRPEVAKLLLERGADPDSKNRVKHTPLHYACGRGDLEMVRLLLDKAKNLNAVSELQTNGSNTVFDGAGNPLPGMNFNSSGTPLMEAVLNGKDAVAKLLIERGADVNVEAPAGRSALTMAVNANQREMAALLLEHRANARMPELLITAVQNGRTELARLLIKHGADVNAKDPQNAYALAPLLVATQSAELTKMLLDTGASPDVANAQGETPLHVVIKMLQNRGQPGNSTFRQGIRPRTRVITTIPRPTAIQPGPQLAQPPPPPNQSGPQLADTPEQFDAFAVMKLLVAKGAKLNVKDSEGRTPFAYAVANENVPQEVLEWLLEKGADPEIADAQGNKPVKGATTMDRRIWLERQIAYPEWAKGQHISAVFRCLGGGGFASNLPISDDPVRITPAAEFDTPPTSLEVLQTMARSLDSKTMIPIDFNLLIFRKTKSGAIEEVSRTPVQISGSDLNADLPSLQWGDVVVVQRDAAGGGSNFASSFQALRHASKDVPTKISIQVGDRKSEVSLSGKSYHCWHVGGVLPSWNFSELVAQLVGAEPRADLSSVKIQRKQPDGKLKEWSVDLRPAALGELVKPIPARLADGDKVVIPLLAKDDPGAIEQRKKSIYRVASGRAFGERIFAFSELDDAPRTLGELIAEADRSSVMVIPNPDPSRIKIHRLSGANGEEETIDVDFAARVEQVSGKTTDEEARKLDFPLRPGDMVEIPTIEGAPLEQWNGLPGQVRLFLGKALAREVSALSNKGGEQIYKLVPEFRQYRPQKLPQGVMWEVSGMQQSPFRSWPLVSREKNLLRVHLVSGERKREFTAETVRKVNPWLQNGDRIEIESF